MLKQAISRILCYLAVAHKGEGGSGNHLSSPSIALGVLRTTFTLDKLGSSTQIWVILLVYPEPVEGFVLAFR